MQIKRISERITSAFKKNDTANTNHINHTNPFVSFKGNIITADVFESAKKVSVFEKLNNKISNSHLLQSERVMNSISAVTNSINNVSNRLNSQWNNVVSFGRRISERTGNAVDFLKNSKIIFDFENPKNLISLDLSNNAYNVKNLVKRDVSELKDEFSSLLEKRGV